MKNLNKPSFWEISFLLFWNHLCWKSRKNHQGYYYLLLTFVAILRHLEFLSCGSQPFQTAPDCLHRIFGGVHNLLGWSSWVAWLATLFLTKKHASAEKTWPFLWINVTGSLIQKLLLRWVVVFQVMRKLSPWGGDHFLLGPLFEGWNIIATSTALTKRSWLGNISSNTKGITSWIVESLTSGSFFFCHRSRPREAAGGCTKQYEFKKTGKMNPPS